MRKTEKVLSWVVFTQKSGLNVVCEQSEWDQKERERPGFLKLVRSGIKNEGEAERLARGASGDTRKSGYRKKP